MWLNLSRFRFIFVFGVGFFLRTPIVESVERDRKDVPSLPSLSILFCSLKSQRAKRRNSLKSEIFGTVLNFVSL